jgi:hypothetical protein
MNFDLRTSLLLSIAASAPALAAQSTVAGVVSTSVGAVTDDFVGWSMANIGDVDGDGADDVAVGAPQAGNPGTGGGATGPGFVRVLSGRTGALLGTVAGLQFGELFGSSIASLADRDGDGLPDASGDVNGDGVPDFLVGAPWFAGANPRQGRVAVVSGATRTILTWINNPTPSTGARFGTSLTGCGDLQGSGSPEFVISAPYWSASGGGVGGRVFLFGWNGTSPSLLATRSGAGSSSGTRLGLRVRCIGDADGNGVADLLVQEDGTQTVLMLATNNFLGAPMMVIGAPVGASGTTFGWSLCGLGDRDGVPGNEFAIGSPQCDTGTCVSAGFVQIRSASASASTLRHTLVPSLRQGSIAIRFGAALAMTGDVDGDAVRDLLVTAPAADPIGTTASTDDAGEVTIFSGAGLTTAGAAQRLLILDGQSGENAGWSVAGLRDVDGDGRGDLAVGSPFYLGSGNPTLGKASIVWHAERSLLYGAGCAPLQVAAPEMHINLNQGPVAGTPFSLRCTQVASNSLCLLALGTAPASVPGFLLPPCTLLVAPDTSVFAIGGNLSFTVPNWPIGFQVFWQWAVVGASFPATMELTPGLRTS